MIVKIECPECNGARTFTVDRWQSADETHYTEEVPCDNCGGTGEVESNEEEEEYQP